MVERGDLQSLNCCVAVALHVDQRRRDAAQFLILLRTADEQTGAAAPAPCIPAAWPALLTLLMRVEPPTRRVSTPLAVWEKSLAVHPG